MAVVAGLWSEVESHTDHAVLRVHGALSLATATRLRATLGKLLGDRGVVVDLSGLRLAWRPAAEVFPAVLAAAGGWPAARMVLVTDDTELLRQLRSLRIHSRVPIVADVAAAVQRLGRRPEQVTRHRDLPVAAAAPAEARAVVRAACEDWSADVAQDAAALVASELVSNAVQHARGGCRLSVSIEPDGLHVRVRDYARGRSPRPRPVDAARAGGRGMHLVVTLATDWGVQEHPDGKTTWAMISLPA